MTSPTPLRPTPATMPSRRQPRPLTVEDGEVLLGELAELRGAVAQLQERVQRLETSGPRGERDDLNDRIVAFLQTTGLRMTALVIAENIDGATNQSIGHRLTRLAASGVIGSTKEAGRTRMYFALPSKA